MQAVGDFGLIMAGLGVIVFWVLFGTSVKWWTDWMGRIIFAFFSSIGIIMALVIIRVFGAPLPGVQIWRAILFTSMAGTIWIGIAGFVYAQFIYPRQRRLSSNSPGRGNS